jgi:Ni/Fe-hydrogenase subunit HybB-like protein
MTSRGSRFPWPRFVTVLAVVAVLGAASALIRLLLGLGATTNMNDGYPWGLWIAADVVVGTALATGGYALALLIYILNRGRYHPLIRPAIVASALGYSLAGVSVALDVGRWWLIWKVPLFFWRWNLHSVLLEVALCIMAYTAVLWIEASPAFLERAATNGPAWLRPYASRSKALLERSLIWIVALGILLPTMHQSSLGTLMYLAGPRLHELWRTPFLPLLYLLSAIAMGYAVVLFESILSSRLHGHKPDLKMLGGLALALLPFMGAYMLVRVGDLLWRGLLGALLSFDVFSVMVWAEMALVVVPAVMIWQGRRHPRLGTLTRAALLMMAAGAVYRFDTYLLAFEPGAHWSYFPSLLEITVTAGIFSFEALAYINIVTWLPVMSATAAGSGAREAHAGRHA